MKARPAVVCPACGALNRPTWEYCARCNESLEGARPAEGSAGTGEGGGGELGASSLLARLFPVAELLAIVVIGAAAWRYSSNSPPLAADPALFTIATRPPEPRQVPAPTEPGAADFKAGRRLLIAGDTAGAAVRLAAAVAASPDDPAYRDLYADALWGAGDRDAALGERAEAARLDPRLQGRYARALDVAGRGAEAVREYEALLAARPGAEAAREELGRLLYRTGDYAKAAPLLQQAVQQRPTDLALRQELGYAQARAGQRDEAATAFREVLRRAPNAVVTRTLLSESLVELGRRDEALAVLQEGLKTSPDTPILYRQLGSVLERSGRPAEAVVAYRSYASLVPNALDAGEIAERAAQIEASARKQ